MSQEIGIIGVGKMGAAMWRCLAAAGTTATVYDTFAPSAKALGEAGAVVATTPAELTAAVDVVILSLPNSGDVEGVVADIVSALRAGVVVIDTTSGEPAISRRVAETVAATGAAYLDAGVSGGPPGAESGTLKIMVGGDAAAFEQAQPVLDILGGRIWHCGGPGTGHAMKTALNLSNQGKMLLEIEALLMCGRAGLDPDQVADVLELNTWRHFLLGEGGRIPFGFAIDLAVKDWGVAAGVASEHKVPMPIAGAAMQTMRAIRAEAGPDADLIDVVSVMEKWSDYDLDAGLGRTPS
jgi:3-hydroxyisobutyrate dehydrogenase-like beta-hydroxyacid dehydrogenase